MPRANREASTGRKNSLGLSMKEIEALLDRIDAQSSGGSVNREFTRWKFRLERVLMKTSHPGGSLVEIPVICRNLSSGGVGVLHSNFVHPGSKVQIQLESTDGTVSQDIRGVVRRCVHREGKIHDIGIEFDQPINVRETLGLDLLSDCFSREVIDAESLSGHVVHVEPLTLDRKIMMHFLRDTQITLRQAETSEQALEFTRQPTDLILLSEELDSSLDFVAQLRAEGSSVPIILVATNTSPRVAAIAKSMRLDAILTKPLGQDLLLRALAEFLQRTGRRDPKGDEQERAARAAVEMLHGLAQELNETLSHNNLDGTLGVVSKLRNVSRRSGFDSIASLAEKAHEDLTETGDIESCIRVLLDLSTACERADKQQAA